MCRCNRYLAIDGDQVGRLLEKRILLNEENAIVGLSEGIRSLFSRLGQMLESSGMKVLINAGDMVLARGDVTPEIVACIRSYRGPVPFSWGIGSSLRLAHIALRVAKARGGGKVIEAIGDLAEDLVFSEVSPTG